MEDLGLNETLQKLSTSISQQAVASINSIVIPEFRGLPDEDIYEFVRRFKVATFTLPDDYRCLALNKALKGAALVWAKSNIRKLIIDAQWKDIKTALYNRFGSPDRILGYRERLSKLKFIVGASTLTAYIETYLDMYKKAYKEHKERDAIKALRLNLPDRIVKGLNLMNDEWSEFEKLSDFLDLVKRYETRIMPFESKSESGTNSLTKETLQSLFKEFREVINNDLRKQREEKAPEIKALGAMAHSAPQKRSDYDRPRYSNQRNQNFHANNNYRHDNYRNNNYKSNSFKKARYDQAYNPKPMLPVNQNNGRRAIEDKDKTQAANPSGSSRPNDFISAYYAKFGRPPGPCYYCEGKHLNRHCPLLAKDLN